MVDIQRCNVPSHTATCINLRTARKVNLRKPLEICFVLSGSAMWIYVMHLSRGPLMSAGGSLENTAKSFAGYSKSLDKRTRVWNLSIPRGTDLCIGFGRGYGSLNPVSQKQSILIESSNVSNSRAFEHSNVWTFERWNARTFERSKVRTFERSNVRTFERSNVRLFERSNVRTFEKNNVRTVERSNVRTFDRLTVPPFEHSKVRTFERSKV